MNSPLNSNALPVSLRDNTAPIIVNPLQKISYEQGALIQTELVEQRKNNPSSHDNLLFFEFDSVYTAGSSTKDIDILDTNLPVISVNRGGSVTWHGPGQLVVYLPIKLVPPLDIKKLVFSIEESIILSIAHFGLLGERIENRRGVWVKNSQGEYNKIAAIGLRTSQNVVSHGLALNCNPDLNAYNPIVPCGITNAGVTSLTKETNTLITVEDAYPILAANLVNQLNN